MVSSDDYASKPQKVSVGERPNVSQVIMVILILGIGVVAVGNAILTAESGVTDGNTGWRCTLWSEEKCNKIVKTNISGSQTEHYEHYGNTATGRSECESSCERQILTREVES